MAKLQADENPPPTGSSSRVTRQRSSTPNPLGSAIPARLPSPLWLVLLLPACGGALGHRSTADGKGQIPVGAAIDRVRIEIENGSLGVDASAAREVTYSGGVRRAADTAELLARIEQVPTGFEVVADPEQPNTLVLRGPRLPDRATGVLGMEVGVHLPADLPLDVQISGSGVVVIANRRAMTHVATGRGDLRFQNCSGGVVAHTGRGNVIAYGHSGVLDIRTGAGDMQTFVPRPHERIRLVTGQGNVQLFVPASLEFDLDARTEIGRISTGFGLTAEKVGDYSAALVARIGRADTKVVLRSASGHVSFAANVFD